jgi:hypothetical protein
MRFGFQYAPASDKRCCWHWRKLVGSANIPTPPVREARVHRLFAIALTLLLVCFASSIAHAQSCTTSNGRIAFPFDPGVNNPFGPGESRTTRFSFNGLVGDTLTFQADPGPPGTSQIALLSAANPSTILATITVSTTASYVLTAANIAASPYVIKFTNNTPNSQDYVVNCIPVSLPVSLLSAVLPESRSVQVNGTATAFATIINTGTSTAINCSIAPPSTLPVTFAYQTTNPTTNAVTGSPNTPVNIAAGASQSFVIALTPTASIAPTDVDFNFSCTNTNPAPVFPGLNTLLFSTSTTPTPDIVALAGTLQNDGIVHVVNGSPMTGVFVVATVNLGSADTITASTNTGTATVPITVTICQTNPQTGVCMNPQTPGTTATTTITANAEPTFGIFVTASGTVAFDPANSRIFVVFTDSTGAVRGETSVAVETQ